MKVNLFNHWFKHKVSIERHFEYVKNAWLTDEGDIRYSNFWRWLQDKHDVGQYYNWREERNYMVFHNEKHYTMFLLKL